MKGKRFFGVSLFFFCKKTLPENAFGRMIIKGMKMVGTKLTKTVKEKESFSCTFYDGVLEYLIGSKKDASKI